ncbi:type II toxin-antitoxin system RelE/ParE family toxin [Parasphingorhabdus sp. NYA22]
MTMYQVEQTEVFEDWLDSLRDPMAKFKIAKRLVRIRSGLLGDWKSLGDGVSELRIRYGPGYRLYYTMRGQTVVCLLCGSDKKGQAKAIAKAKEMAKQI